MARSFDNDFYTGMAKKEGRGVGASIEKAHEKALGILSAERIDMQSFIPPHGNYDPAMVEADTETVERLDQKYEERMLENPNLRELKHTATVFEMIIATQAKENRWFGGNTEIIPTTLYDDYVNGVDGILRIKEASRDQFLALGIDITFSGVALDQNIEKIGEEIKAGKMAEVKYFALPDNSFKGHLKNVPRIVLSAEASSVVQMAEQWVNEDPKTFARHWMQFQLLESAIEQCLYFSRFAMIKGHGDIAAAYNGMHDKLNKIYALRKKLVQVPEDRDRMQARIGEQLRALK